MEGQDNLDKTGTLWSKIEQGIDYRQLEQLIEETLYRAAVRGTEHPLIGPKGSMGPKTTDELRKRIRWHLNVNQKYIGALLCCGPPPLGTLLAPGRPARRKQCNGEDESIGIHKAAPHGKIREKGKDTSMCPSPRVLTFSAIGRVKIADAAAKLIVSAQVAAAVAYSPSICHSR